MTARITIVAATAMALAACACHKTAPSESAAPRPAPVRSVVPISSVHLDRTAGRQVEGLRWNRDGTWTLIEVSSQYSQIQRALVSRDAMGDRLLVASPSAGYQLARIRLDCERGGFSVDAARRVASDGVGVSDNKDDRSLMPIVARAEISRICRPAGLKTDYRGAPSAVVSQLREASSGATVRAEPSAEARAAAWKAYQAGHPSAATRPDGK